ncbi:MULTISPECIES: hypothetical protein [unclassified Bradyrhizobium]|uniref:TolA protein n=1 Tax=Bradyrhizobium sp. LLZ17 TaxID=3239388 RepID=A0AB39XN99_9BRAD
METRKIIRTDIAASAIAHLTLVALVILVSEVRPFHPAPPEAVTVDVVTPEQVKQEEAKAEEKAKEKALETLPDLKLPKLDFTEKDKAEAAAQPSVKPQKPSQPQSAPKQREANAQPQTQPPQPQAQQPQQPPAQSQLPAQQSPPQPQPASQPPAMPQPGPPAYQPPEPDVTIKYGVLLGLPPELPAEPKDDGGDAKDTTATKLAPEVIAELRRHLRSCAKLPAGVAVTDNVRIKLRAVLTTDGTLARPPILIEAPPSAKGVAVVKSAMSALQACQPYKMLPVDKYEEWKVLDLPFTPQDFGG